jgi:type II secretory pathway component PulF
MKLDEFAFFNQQLAAMVREGIPLEGAMRQLSAGMQRGELRAEIEALEADLGRGTPLAQALESRTFPKLYCRLLVAGTRGQDLAKFLSRIADHYHEQHLLWTRLKALMTYPVLVLVAVFGLSLLVQTFVTQVYGEDPGALALDVFEGRDLPWLTAMALPLLANAWIFPVGFGAVLFAVLGILGIPGVREQVLWRLPAFREAALSRIAGTLSLLLERALPLPEAVKAVEDLEQGTQAAIELREWRERLAQGETELSRMTAGGRFFPPLFGWLASQGGASLAEGFRRAGEVYRARAAARTEIMMHAALPVAVLTLGVLIALQAVLMISMFLPFITLLDSLG